MIKIENVQIVGWEPALRGMRNPKNSWSKSDSKFICPDEMTTRWRGEPNIGPNDHKLIMSLVKGGAVHAKFRRMIVVYVDVTAPLYWWKEYDTYKVGTVANSCSTMHKIMDHEFTEDDFSWDGIEEEDGEWVDSMALGYSDAPAFGTGVYLEQTLELLNFWRDGYLEAKEKGQTKKQKKCWKNTIKLLGTAYNQKRTLMLNYEVLHGIYFSRKNHKLDEWVELCKWIEALPYSEIITTPESRTDISFEDVIAWIKGQDDLTDEQYKELRLAVMNQRCCGLLEAQMDLLVAKDQYRKGESSGYHVNHDGSFDCDGPIKER